MSAKEAYQYWLENWSDMKDHLPRLYAAAKGQCLEIGVRCGVSTSALLAGLEDHGGYLCSIDVNDCRVFQGHPQWKFVQGDTQTITDELKAAMREFDLAFIDGDHTYEGALSDLQNFGSKAKRIFVHDTDAPDFPGVRKAVEEFAAKEERPVTFHPGSFGMAEIN